VDVSFDDPRLAAFGALLEANARLVATLGAELEGAAGLPLSSYEVLLRLARSGDQRLRLSELAAQVALSTSGLTRLVDRLEAAGYLAREACPTDRRGLFAVLTAEGREVLGRATDAHLEGLDRHLSAPLAPGELEQLRVLLGKLAPR
jgi:DNA-binding MarR family transcriptional regulator